jgi:hypothetical protein
MGYFDGLADASFKENAEGKTVYYPRGVYGAGYVVESEEVNRALRKRLKKVYAVAISIAVILAVSKAYWAAGAYMIVFGIWDHFAIKKLTKDLPKTSDKMSFGESYRNSAKSHNLATLILLEISALLFTAVGVWLYIGETQPLLGLASAVFFGACSVPVGFMIRFKIGERRNS